MTPHELDWSVRPTACTCGGFASAGSKTFTLERFAVHLRDVIARYERERENPHQVGK